MHLATRKGGVNATCGSKDQFLLVEVIVSALLQDKIVVSPDPAGSLLSDAPFEMLDDILCEPVFAVVIA